tara:strand:+ start:395 stop:877 length:483 start_codon:yes stop_codon:yes gene_type:complete
MQIKLLISDFDGVFTDNSVYISQDGKESVKCSRADGYGIKAILDKGISFIICSSEKIPIAEFRGSKIGFPVFTGIEDKGHFLEQYIKENNFKFNECAYIGNDINDLAAFQKVKHRLAVKDAYQEVIDASTFLLNKKGGQGAVREACQFVINYNDRFPSQK